MEGPVYPKENPEYRKKVLNALYKKVSSTKWEKTVETEPSNKGRKPAPAKERIEAKPRTQGEAQAFQKGTAFDKWIKKS